MRILLAAAVVTLGSAGTASAQLYIPKKPQDVIPKKPQDVIPQLPRIPGTGESTPTVITDPNPIKPLARVEFRTDGSDFVKSLNGRWTEFRQNGPKSLFREAARTDAYVELYDAARNMSVRLYSDRGVWWDNGKWVMWPGSNGSWVR
jgi:hypothetical protein